MKRLCFLAAFVLGAANPVPAQKILDYIGTYVYANERDSFMTTKEVYEFNAANQITSKAIYEWDSNRKIWIGSMFPVEECIVCTGKTENTYDPNGHLILAVGLSWDFNESLWVTRSQVKSDYDENGNRIYEEIHWWDLNLDQMVPAIGLEYRYEDRGLKTSADRYIWDAVLNTWKPEDKEDFAYNGSGRQTVYIQSRWNTEQRDWVYSSKTEWYFNAEGVQTGSASFSWTMVNNRYVWKETGRNKMEHVLDSRGHIILTTWFSMSGGSGWQAYQKQEKEFDTSGRPVSNKLSKMGSNGWYNYLLTEWKYDANGNLISEAMTGKMKRTMGLTGNYKVHRAFDTAGDKIVETWYYWDSDQNDYVFGLKDYFFYRSGSTGIQYIKTDPVSLYPNPTDRWMTLSGLTGPADVKIYSIQGEILRQYRVENTLDIHDLPAGTYILHLIAGNQAPFRSLIVKK